MRKIDERARTFELAIQPSMATPQWIWHVLALSLTTCTVLVASEEEACPIGKYLLANVTCTECLSGFYCPGINLAPRPCPPGSANSLTGQGNILACLDCPPGSYSSQTAHTSCLPCPDGFECPGLGTISPDPCPVGTYAVQNGNSGPTNCTECPLGAQCPFTFSNPVPCVDGYYANETKSTVCLECPAGYKCLVSSLTPTKCLNGMYSLAGSQTCTLCPAGTYCPSEATELPLPCSSGQFASPGAMECSLCPVGHFCPDVQLPPQACPVGMYNSFAGQVRCIPCERDRQCLDGISSNPCPHGTQSQQLQADCSPCEPGTYSLVEAGSSGNCILCPPGYFCFSPELEPSRCQSGYVAPGGSLNCNSCLSGTTPDSLQSLCVPCPAGHSCADPRLSPQPCPPGTYILQGINPQCLICPQGHSCPSQELLPILCPVESYAPLGSTECLLCPSGASCSGTNLPVPCQPGGYSVQGDPLCRECPAGYYCPSPSLPPIPCSSGFYSIQGSLSCLPCPRGSSCPTTSLPPVGCPLGSYSLENSTSCTICPAGFSCVSTSQPPVVCRRGYYSSTEQVECVICPPGFECPTPDQLPVSCTSGYYSDGGATNCLRCPAGQACPDTASSLSNFGCVPGTYSIGFQQHCTLCSPGSYCPDTRSSTSIPCTLGSYSLSGQSSCTPCPPGMACPSIDGSLNVMCSSGTYSIGRQVACTACPPGFKCPVVDQAQELSCPPGTYSIGSQKVCTSCPPGFECPFTNVMELLACEVGYFSAGNQSSCTRCPPGNECPNQNMEVIIPCQEGYFSTGGKALCQMCTRGFACSNTDSLPVPCHPGTYSRDQATNCSLCDPGRSCTDPSVPPTPCQSGTWAPEGSTGCLLCHPGYQCPEESTTPSPEDHICPQGGWCDGKDFSPCPAGSYGNVSGSRNMEEACEVCPPGYYCPNPGATEFEDSICPEGHFCPAGTVFQEQFPCPAGTFNNATMQTSIAGACSTLCNPGFFCPQGSASGMACPAGYFCPEGTPSARIFPCPLGTYGPLSMAVSSRDCVECPSGHYCPSGSLPTTSPVPCRPGTYNPLNGTGHKFNCLLCPAGMSCATLALSEPSHSCDEGHYCPNGTIQPHQYPCPPGTFSSSDSLQSPEECSVCPAGNACRWGTGFNFSAPLPCAQGHYCPSGTPTPNKFPCPPGTFTEYSNLTSEGECTRCPPNYYCEGGEGAPTGLCPPGFICPERTRFPYEFPCHERTYNPNFGANSTDSCLNCTIGHFCEAGYSHPESCPPGTYMPFGYDNILNELIGLPIGNKSECLICPGGHFCAEGSVNPDVCGPGKFSPPGVEFCLTCRIGHFCDENATSEMEMELNKQCPPGNFCAPGLRGLEESVLCDAGFYCPQGNIRQNSCPPGTYNPLRGQHSLEQCIPCDPGYYCLQNSTQPTGPCLPGFYCPTNITNGESNLIIGSYGPTQLPCPGGTYLENFASSRIEDCIPCPNGTFCSPSSSQTTICDIGYYCPINTEYPIPCPSGTIGNENGLKAESDCKICPAGHYCDSPGLTAPRGPCDSGFVCYLGANTSTPTDGLTGEICPPGGYCPLGSSVSLPCPPGTFSNISGSIDTFDCFECTPGFFCASARTPEPSGPCNAGYYCTGGSRTPNDTVTPAGHYTFSGSSAPIPCDVGTWMPHEAAGECYPCTAGYFCPGHGNTNLTLCPVGYYCSEGSDDFLPCPLGTYSDRAGLKSMSECLFCPPGQFCASGGLSQPDGLCFAGHVCFGNSSLVNPVESDEVQFGGLCESGYYCIEGSAAGTPCPLGTFSNARGLKDVSECTPCLPGMSCNSSGLTEPSKECRIGYFCKRGAKTNSPIDGVTGNICPRGMFCIQGSSAPRLCLFGTYSNTTGLGECIECPAGYFCHPLLGVEPVLCRAGSYCPPGSGLNFNACPVGTLGLIEGLAEESQCVRCPGGFFCDSPGRVLPSGSCAAGFFCNSGATSMHPLESPNSGPCPAGFYCPENSASPIACDIGTYSSSAFNVNQSECIDCDPGHFCDRRGLDDTAGMCNAGYYCSSGSSSATPFNVSFGDVCPVGHFCPLGSTSPRACPPGTYSNSTGLSQCVKCPKGFYCENSVVDPFNFPCPPGYFCTEGSRFREENPCGLSTYNPSFQATDLSACLPCPSGMFCNGTGLDSPYGTCQAGSICALGSSSPTGELCRPGAFCPKATTFEIPCPAGNYCAGFGNIEPTGLCSPGYFCVLGASSSTPTDGMTGRVCPSGTYCMEGSLNPNPCLMGTFGTTEGAVTVEEGCVTCPIGRYCGEFGLTSPSGVCSAGYYCPTGQSLQSPSEFICPAGYFCTEGSFEPIQCPSGTFQNQTGQNTCLDCPSGYFCDNTDKILVSLSDSMCPPGHYCPAATRFSVQYPCPRGTFSNQTRLSEESMCSPCTAGHYCDSTGLLEPSGTCQPGYFCSSGSLSSNPSTGLCGAGFYCPPGTVEPMSCLPGTYNPEYRQLSVLSCLPCTAGHFCQESNSSTPTGLCAPGYYCPSNSSAFIAEWLLCPVGHYCPIGSIEPTPCLVGQFSNATGLTSSVSCLPCPPGYFCNQSGSTEPAGMCSSGYFCPEGSSFPSSSPCPVGFYCPRGSANPLPCQDGTYSSVPLLESCFTCPAGQYCVFQSRSEPCPVGFYCIEGTGRDFLPCPRGTYSSAVGLSQSDQCSPCEPGMYCNGSGLSQPTGLCQPGYYCTFGVDRSQPLSNSDIALFSTDNASLLDEAHLNSSLKGVGGVCPAGFYCPEGTVSPIPCPVGTFSDSLGVAACEVCPAGMYCPVGTAEPSKFQCSPGYYCTAGSSSDRDSPCPSGTYLNDTGASRRDQCLACPNGSYCLEPGIQHPTGPCSPGYFCTEGSTSPNPSRFSNFGGPCPIGHFCPQGTSTPMSCLPGMYCERELLAFPTGPCRGGYYCLMGAVQPNPTDNVTGNICPSGSYCTPGTIAPFLCEPGTFSNILGLAQGSDCIPCTPGHYCGSFGLIEPTGLCEGGFYCLSGQIVPAPANFICQPGHSCPRGTPGQVICPLGTFQDEYGMIDCKPCPAGFVCDSTFSPVSNLTNRACPKGNYCPEGTRFAGEYPCPIGTFSNKTGLVNESQCTSCFPGSACTLQGLAEPDFLCRAGYFCLFGAMSVIPSQGLQANRCPVGHYCEEGTVDPTPCPLGTYNPYLAINSVNECIPCTGGSFCGEFGLAQVQGECSAGYFCDRGAINSTWMECSSGHYCPPRSSIPSPCPVGTYSPFKTLTDVSECIQCPAGFFCSERGAVNYTGLCSSGFFCPSGSSTPDTSVCPTGLHCPEGSALPRSCDPGYFTNTTQQSSCQICPSRYYCVPTDNIIDQSFELYSCPEGYFCPRGTGLDWKPCPSGTFSNTTGLASRGECLQCAGGHYCSGIALIEPSGVCNSGYFCSFGVDTPTPTTSTLNGNRTFYTDCGNQSFSCTIHPGVGDLCPPGHYCPEQSAYPISCEAGMYNNRSGQESCFICPTGFHCPKATVDYSLHPCPPGNYCPIGSAAPQKCLPGTFNPNSQSQSILYCLSCLPGMFCMGYGLILPSGNCSEGWFCDSGAILPNSSLNNYICSLGHYCPEGSSAPLPCPAGQYCGELGLSEPQGLCEAGYICTGTSSSPTPHEESEGGPCMAGHFCPQGTLSPQPCPPGTFSNSSFNNNVTDCMPCTSGHYCSSYGLTSPTGLCNPGYFCPPGLNMPTPSSSECPFGHFCPEGSSFPRRCPNGKFQANAAGGQENCSLCPAGYYCDTALELDASIDNPICPEGYYCPEGTPAAFTFPCPRGSYSNRTGLSASFQCSKCDPGRYCLSTGMRKPSGFCSPGYYCRYGADSPAPSLGEQADICPAGRFCPQGTVEPFHCPVGTFSNVTGLTLQEECTDCTGGHYCFSLGLVQPSGPCQPGYFCPQRSTTATEIPCTSGSFCEEGSIQPTGCPEGAYSNATGLASSNECLSCPRGMFCRGLGQTSPFGFCSEGYYCPPGSKSPTPVDFICPIGSFCPPGSSWPQLCPNGTFSMRNQSGSCDPCPAGFFCIDGFIAGDCPQGYYCEDGTGPDWSPCPVGTISDQFGLTDVLECMPCPAGRFCSERHAVNYTGLCEPGYFCITGVSVPTPISFNYSNIDVLSDIDLDSGVFRNNIGVGGICPRGAYCPKGSAIPLPCPVGYYSNETGLSECVICPSGYYCPTGTSDFTSYSCPVGHYCPVGTRFAQEYPCPVGTFSNSLQLRDISDCSPCTAGYYCNESRLISPSGLCSGGYYCISGSSTPSPMQIEPYGGPCDPGFYCPEGTSVPFLCDAGYLCALPLLSSPEDVCDPGYFCSGGAVSGRPVGGSGGNICPLGNYCPENSSSPTPCPPGTFSNRVGNMINGDCELCSPGLFCNEFGSVFPSGVCSEGYYCPGGQNTSKPQDFICPPGHFCSIGSVAPQVCPAGTYQDKNGQVTCNKCPAGFVCDSTQAPVTALIHICPVGYFCPTGTRFENEYPCPLGSWSNATGLSNTTQCSPCPRQYFCNETGLSSPSGLCSAGYYCVSGAESPTPIVSPDIGDECPMGYYCPLGTDVPIECPKGTFSNQVRLTNESDCRSCLSGHFCDNKAATATSGLCLAGYYCPPGSVSNVSTACPAGFYCPEGTPDSQPCPLGTFSSSVMLSQFSECLPCTPGYFCDRLGLTEPIGLCDEGFQCPLGSATARPFNFTCPIGHACPENASNPIPCEEGTYSNQTSATECFPCPPGFYCLKGLLTGRCPRGFYCLAGTGFNWLPCPKQTYSNQFGLSVETQCTLCDGGRYCSELNATEPTGDCSPGYFCTIGNSNPMPDTVNLNTNTSISMSCNAINFTPLGGICPVGHHCPIGSTIPLLCPAGSYANETGLSLCHICPKGFFCHVGAISFEDSVCPPGYYCPPGTEVASANPCPPGTYSNSTNLGDISQCLQCPAGFYCDSTEVTSVTGPCSNGWYCSGGASSPTPSSPSEGGASCTRGFFCPEQSTAPVPCTGGSYCDRNALSFPSGLCSSGYYCILESPLPTPVGLGDTVGDICPAGHFCLEGASSPQRCPPGTFSSHQGNTNFSDCLSCPPGQFCAGYSRINPSGNCSRGYYCPGGNKVDISDFYLCPAGHFCVSGSHEPRQCQSGFYQDESGQESCKICPGGFFCDSTTEPVVSFNDSLCPRGFACPSGTEYSTQYPCNIGSFSNITGLRSVNNCTPCTGGMFCDIPGLSWPRGLCSAGYFCLAASTSPTPQNESKADICPQGHFCPEGSILPSPCLFGTFSDSLLLENATQCLLCPPGLYCQEQGLISPEGNCSEGFYCPEGSASPRQEVCSPGHYCPESSGYPLPCPLGTFSSQPNLINESECQKCTGGLSCDVPGLTSPNGVCDPGFYCPTGSKTQHPVEYKCPVGYFCPGGTSTPLPCNGSSYTDATQQSSCLECPAGFYCVGGVIVDRCPEGYYCMGQTSLDWLPCPRGTFSNKTGLSGIDQCIPCPSMHYCSDLAATEPTGLCNEGHYCVLANFVANPIQEELSNISSCFKEIYVGDICPQGHYCPLGSFSPLPCPAGYYSPHEGLESCLICPSGFFCLEGSVGFLNASCPSGYFCPRGTGFPTEHPCPKGTINNSTGLTNESQCQPCPSGQYCSMLGLNAPTGPCSSGWFCIENAITPTPGSILEGGGVCMEGYFCPEGSSYPLACSGGKYCNASMLSRPSGLCAPGYYCRSGSSVSNPSGPNDSIGGVCLIGHYCPTGSSFPIPCPPGTFSNTSGNFNLTNCLSCTPGEYCEGMGSVAPTGMCKEGFFCPAGQDNPVPTNYSCPPGYFCLSGSPMPILCPSGSFQTLIGQTECLICPAGYVCDSTIVPVTTLEGRLCPAGSFCPPETRNNRQFLCPEGAYSNKTGLMEANECSTCDPGMYCPIQGLTSPLGPCHEGYFCKEGAISSMPNQSLIADICPLGAYCPTGSAVPILCPIGTFNPVAGVSLILSCQNCTGGMFCNSTGLSEPSGSCEAGYFCESGAQHPRWRVCPAGSFCIEQSIYPQPCPLGTFSQVSGLSSELFCQNCLVGSFCNETGLVSVSGPCLQGYYCPEGQRTANPLEFICSPGFHCLEGSSHPFPCPSGYFTNLTGQYECSVCPPGFFCVPISENNQSRAYQLCPAGYYCLEGTGLDWLPCPVGTFSNSSGLSSAYQCTLCPGGYYCGELHATEPTGVCNPGYFCNIGARQPSPLEEQGWYNISDSLESGSGESNCPKVNSIAGPCPTGHYCPMGSSNPIPCINGTYSGTTISSSCDMCPSGFYCPDMTSNFSSFPCPPGHFCPEGSGYIYQYPCPSGTYNPAFNSVDESGCVACDPGMYCSQDGLTLPQGPCSPGWICITSSTSPEPLVESQGRQCSPGEYCPSGSSTPIPCDPGYYCSTSGLDRLTGPCSAGYFCIEGSNTSTPTNTEIGDICQPGHYCVLGSSYPIPCPSGTFFGSFGSPSITECKPCSPGQFCEFQGSIEPQGFCSPGYYCPGGQNVSTPSDFVCQQGYYCPLGSIAPVICPLGTYQDERAQAVCIRFVQRDIIVIVLQNL